MHTWFLCAAAKDGAGTTAGARLLGARGGQGAVLFSLFLPSVATVFIFKLPLPWEIKNTSVFQTCDAGPYGQTVRPFPTG